MSHFLIYLELLKVIKFEVTPNLINSEKAKKYSSFMKYNMFLQLKKLSSIEILSYSWGAFGSALQMGIGMQMPLIQSPLGKCKLHLIKKIISYFELSSIWQIFYCKWLLGFF